MCEKYNGRMDYNCMIHQAGRMAELERSMGEYAISDSYKSFTGEY